LSNISASGLTYCSRGIALLIDSHDVGHCSHGCAKTHARPVREWPRAKGRLSPRPASKNASAVHHAPFSVRRRHLLCRHLLCRHLPILARPRRQPLPLPQPLDSVPSRVQRLQRPHPASLRVRLRVQLQLHQSPKAVSSSSIQLRCAKTQRCVMRQEHSQPGEASAPRKRRNLRLLHDDVCRAHLLRRGHRLRRLRWHLKSWWRLVVDLTAVRATDK
jgi:hypothetical protein